MFKMSEYSLVAGVIATALSIVCYAAALATVRLAQRRTSLAPGGAGGGTVTVVTRGPSGTFATYGTLISWLAFTFLTASLIFRTIHTGHGPFANMYEFSVAFAWGALGMYLYFEYRYHQRVLGLIALPVAIVAYGTFTIAFAAAVLYLIQPEGGRRGLPRLELLDEVSYRAVVIGFPFMTLVIILGAVWADVAWGSYWGWDPKETASLVTWLIYGAYLHARVVRGWRGRPAAWLLILGVAATLFTYFGNLFFGGLHSYAGLGDN
jgi:ABC-type transport system involved in cytochrome c biogenesis permease subunit